MKRHVFIVLFLLIGALVLTACNGTPATTAPAAAAVPSAVMSQGEPPATSSPTSIPATSQPSATPTSQPTPTQAAPATQAPIEAPTKAPTDTPTNAPTLTDTPAPTAAPATPTSTPTNVSGDAKPAEASCTDVASFSDDITIPDGTVIKVGEKFVKTWRVRNEGTCVWSGYKLVYAGGEPMNGTTTTIPNINPQEYGNISIDLAAPQRGGPQAGYWLFLTNSGKVFGVGVPNNGTLWVKIVVDYPTPPPPPVESPGSGSSSGSNQNAACGFSQNADYVNQILALVNEARAQNGLNGLTIDAKLSAAALAHSSDMACSNQISHTGSDGSSWYDRVKAQGFANYVTARENIYAGTPDFGGDAKGAFTWWMNSQIHRDNILYATVTRIGIGYAFYANSDLQGYFTLIVARP